MHRLTPPLLTPTLLPSHLPLSKILELPEVVDGVQRADLGKPCSNALHDVSSRLEARTPVRLPLQQVAGVERVRAQLEDAAEVARWGRGPEGELLHQVGAAAGEEPWEGRSKFLVVGRVGGEVVKGVVVASIALVFPYVHCTDLSVTPIAAGWGVQTERVAISNLRFPATNQMAVIGPIRRDLGVGIPHELHVLGVLVGLDMVEFDGVDVLSSGEHGGV